MRGGNAGGNAIRIVHDSDRSLDASFLQRCGATLRPMRAPLSCGRFGASSTTPLRMMPGSATPTASTESQLRLAHAGEHLIAHNLDQAVDGHFNQRMDRIRIALRIGDNGAQPCRACDRQ